MRLKRVVIENYRAISRLELHLHPQVNVLIGGNGDGKTSVLNAIAVGLGAIPKFLPEVSSVDFLKTDRRRGRPVRVELESRDGARWERTLGGPKKRGRLDALRARVGEVVAADGAEARTENLPIIAFYDTDRALRDPALTGSRFVAEFPRFEALEGALSAGAAFPAFVKWFRTKEHEELGIRNEKRDFDYALPDLNAAREAVLSMVPEIRALRIAFRPLRFEVTWRLDDGEEQRLRPSQLGGGYRMMLALAGDLARRMAQGNPHLDDPLQSEAVVLIDEVDLHLRPSWQQRVLPDLMRTFPNTQFLVSTHSPQVLTTVESGCIVHLAREDGEIGAFGVPISTYGARASDALETVMGVDERPAGNSFVKDLRRYLNMVTDGDGESFGARRLREKLVESAPQDPDLAQASLEIQRQRVMRNFERK